ncbi:hypothetical protein ACIPC1_16030 [Streptomyces sp. NPDC087263]|uniref:hypothetical protein n=1 Tax=Streptomyces sp. NPDC087263 TaxID=3365773 RepID=UPI0038148247
MSTAQHFDDEVSITVPYWHTGDRAATVLGKLFALSALVEKETGLTAYDAVGKDLSTSGNEHHVGRHD